MSSASVPRDQSPAESMAAESIAAESGDDRTARARIRDAALHLFGERGVRAATMRDIAQRAGVSPALVVHHFASKQGLREAVDDHLLAEIRTGKYEAMTGSLLPTASDYEGMVQDFQPAIAYLARALAEDTEVGRHLYDRLYADAVGYLAAGVEAGVVAPSDDPERRAAILLNIGLGQLVLRAHLQRTLDVPEDQTWLAVAGPLLDLYTDGLFTDDRIRSAWRAETTHVAGVADPDPPSDMAAGTTAP